MGAAAIRRVDALLHGTPGALALAGRHELSLDHGSARPARRIRRRARRARSRRRSSSADELERASAGSIALRDATVGRAQRSAAHGARGRRRSPVATRGRRARRLPRRAAGAVGARPARGARPRLGRPAPVRVEPRPDVDDPAVAGRARRAHRDPLFQTGSVRVAGGVPAFVYKAAAEIGELGDNTRALRAGDRRRPLLRLALAQPDAQVAVLGHTRWASVGIISEPNSHPLNSDELEQRGGESRRTWSPRSTATSTTTPTSRCEHELRIPGPITTDAKVIPAVDGPPRRRRRRDLVEAFRRTVAEFEGSVAIGAAAADQPGRAVPGAPRQRPGRCTSVWPTTATSSPASRTAWSRRPTRLSCRLDGEQRRPGRRARRRRTPASSTAFAASPTTARELPVDRRRRRDGRGHHPRHRSRRLAALPAEGDHARRRRASARRCAARSSSVDGLLPRRRRRPRAAAGRRRPAGRRHDHAGSASSGRARRPSPAQHGRRARRARATAASTSTPITATELTRLRAAPRHERHAGHRRQPERHDHRHQPHRRPAPRPRRRGARHRQPAQQRPHRQGRRRDVHSATVATSR